MDLPQELIDEIINHVSDDKKSLRNYSLVARSWVHPTRRRIFRDVNVSNTKFLGLWLDKIPPTNVEILQHVRSLSCHIADCPDSPHPSVDLLRDYWPSFCQLESLSFSEGFLPSLTQIGTYSAFQHTLLYLSMQYCTATANALVTLVNYFPNLTHLDLCELYHEVDGRPASPFSRPVQKLTISKFFEPDLIDQLMGLQPQCEEITIDTYWYSCPSLTQHVIDGVEASIKRLNLESDFAGVCNAPKMA